MSGPGWNIPPLTRQRQALAAEPTLSAWVSANAGSGKTHVLVNRVLRLLLDGVAPSRILCITYTKAAAANMANRIFRTLGSWATVGEAELAAALGALTGELPDAATAAAARRLFARALETPGGLKIETIHAFCTRVLQSAPFEANVPARFEIADEVAQAELMREARRELLAGVAADPAGELAGALDLLAREAAQDTFGAIVQEALGRRELFSRAQGGPRDGGEMRRSIAAALGIAPDLGVAEIEAQFRLSLTRQPGIEILIAALAAGARTRQEAAAGLRAALADAGPLLDGLGRCLLTAAGEVKVDLIGRTEKTQLPPDAAACLEAVVAALREGLDRRNAVAIRDRSSALAAVVTRVLASYQRLKTARSLLDYDDLIARTRSLLDRVDPAWVLYKLDAGIDHVLVDEAQDTSKAQWVILRRLVSEFTAGLGARPETPKPRTLFVVGDAKQSIYGFQGADPASFAVEQRRLGEGFSAAGARFEAIGLNTSFRSAPDIMRAVDAVFAIGEHARGLVFEAGAGAELHDTVRVGAAGAVDLWPVEADDPDDAPDAWRMPLDAPERRSGLAKLSARIAAVLGAWQRAGRDDLGRPFKPGDVMILLRQRGPLFESIVKALKDAGVPVTGRDRLSLATHPAVEDMLVLGRSLLLPEDDLSLATMLKTPLFGLDDADLMRFAPERTGSLREALRMAADGDLVLAAAERRLDELAREASRCGPFRFYARLLGPYGARSLALARLGPEAGDALDAFLGAALDYERRYGPSLFGFLRHIAGVAAEVKRDLSRPGSEVRVMTVHGAKGLEAPIVLIPDLAPAPTGQKLPKLMALAPADGAPPVPIWPPRREQDCAVTAAAKLGGIAGMIAEHQRLLYVALTRAEDRLILCGAAKDGSAPPGSWYGMVEAGLMAAEPPLAEVAAPVGGGVIRRFMTAPPSTMQPHEPAARAEPAPEPDWLRRPVAAEAESLPPLRPSNALAAAGGVERVADGPFLAEAAAAGRLAHLLLQILPEVAPERRAETAAALARARAGALPQERREAIAAAALALIAEPGLAALFGPGSLAEVPVAGDVRAPDGSPRPVSGRIDRLAIGAEDVLIADFKTAAAAPATAAGVPEATLAQLGAYRALLAQIYPGRRVRALAIYTATLAVLEPEPAALEAALARAAGETRFTGG